MKLDRKTGKIIYTSSLMLAVIMALALAAVRTLALLTEFDADASYYSHGAILPTVFGWGAFVFVLIMIALTVVMRGNLDEIDVASDSSFIIFISSLLAFVIMLGTILGSASDGASSLISIVAKVLSIPAAAYLILCFSMPIKSRTGQILLAVCMILWMFSFLMGIYFEGGIEMNNPNRMICLASLAIGLLYFVAEGRYRLGTQHPVIYVALGFAVIIVFGTYSIPNLVLAFMGAYPDTIHGARETICAGIFLYVLLRMCIYSGMISGDDSDDDDEDEDDDEYDDDEDDNYAVNNIAYDKYDDDDGYEEKYKVRKNK